MSSLAVTDLSILLVEPSATQLKIILGHLQDESVGHVIGVHTGRQALTALDKYRPDLMISSMYLPDMTVAELITIIRTTKNSRICPSC